jgi:histidinol-phosphate aminotransferase
MRYCRLYAMSYFRPIIDEIDGYQPGYQPKAPGFVKLNTNENPYPPSPRALEAIRAACGEGLHKYPDPMAEKLRQEAAKVYGTVPERILCGNGSDDLLNIAVRSFCEKGDIVAFPHPTYDLYGTLAKIHGAQPVAVPFPPDYALPAELASTSARLTIVGNPNSPSATFVPPDHLAALAEALDGVLLIDEAYVDFAEVNCLDFVGRYDNVVVTRTLSKSHSLAGLRVGLAIAQERLIQGMGKVKDSYNLDALAIAGGAAAIADTDWLRQNVEKIKATRERLFAELQLMGFLCWPSQANFILARVPKGRNASDIYSRLFERKILIRYFDAPRLDDCLRISVGSDAETDALLTALAQILAGSRS